MRKLLALVFLISSIQSFSQFNVVPRSTGSNTVQDVRVDIKSNLFIPKYLDTTAANAAKGIDSSGAIIKTYVPDAMWVRANNPRRWMNLLPTGSLGSLATVATTGAYSDLSGKPTIPVQVQPDWNATSGLSAILNKPASTNIAMSVATLRTTNTTTNTIYDLLDYGGGQVKDLGLSDGNYVDDDGMTFISANGHALQRIIDGVVKPEFWKGYPNDGVNDTAAFGKMTRYCVSSSANIELSAGYYDLNKVWIVPGRTDGSGIFIKGEGARVTWVRLRNVIGIKRALQYGSTTSNTLHGQIEDFGIEADSTIDGLTVSSYAPTSNAFNVFNNIFFLNVKEGITFEGNPANLSSNYQNFFNNMMIEGHWGVGINNTGVMNTFTGGFVVAPYGTHGIPRVGVGANSMAVFDYGSANTYWHVRTEDQWLLNGSRAEVGGGSTIELIQKTVANSQIGAAAIRIGGSGNKIDGFTITTVPKAIIESPMYVYGNTTILKNMTYLNPTGPDSLLYALQYPILVNPTSSGTMENINIRTTYPLNHPVFADGGIKNWTITETLGDGDSVFSQIRNLKVASQDLTPYLNKNVSSSIPAYLTFPNGLTASYAEFNGYTYGRNYSFSIRNRADNAWLPASSLNTTGTENVLDYTNVGSILASGNITGAIATANNHLVPFSQLKDSLTNLRNGLVGSGGIEGDPYSLHTSGGTVTGYAYFTGGAQLADGSVIDGILYDRSNAHFGRNKAESGYLPLVGRDLTGSEAVWNYDYIGTLNPNGNEVNFGGIASAQGFGMKIGATTVAKIVPNGLDANNAGWTFQRKSGGNYFNALAIRYTGVSNFFGRVSGARAVEDSEYLPLGQFNDTLNKYVKKTDSTTISLGSHMTGNGTVGTPLDVDVSTIYRSGSLSFVSDGSATSYTIVLSSIPGLSSSNKVVLTSRTAMGAALDYADLSTESITLYFITAPSAGTKSVNYIITP